MRAYISRIWGEETPQRIAPKFFVLIDIRDIITPVKFGDDRLRGLGLVLGQSSPFPIDFVGHPYNTLTLLSSSVVKYFAHMLFDAAEEKFIMCVGLASVMFCICNLHCHR